MPFIASVSKPASSYFNCGVGQFVSPDTTHAVLCGINKITLVSCGAGKETTDASIVKEFALAATLKYAETVAVYDPITKQLLRHILFLCSIRQEVSLVCFALHPETGEMVMVPLYHHKIDHSRYQVHPGEVHLCSTTNHSRSSTPFIAFCISCGEVYMLDVLAAIYPTEGDAECGGDRNWAWDYPPLKALSAQRQGAVYSRTTFDATEYDVRDFAFGLPSSPDGSTDLPFYVLYADAHSKSHVSSYAFSTKESSHQLLNPKPFLFLDDTCAWSENRLTQRTLLQENVEGSAAKLAVSPAGVFVVGGHLISLVTSSSHRKKKTITHELPFTHGVARETICVCFTKPNDLLTCYTDGTVVQISVKEIKTPVVSVKMELRTTRLPTLPSAVAVVKPSLLILASRFDDNCIYNMKSETATSLGTHFGPVVDMCTMSRNSITSVVASTGIGRRGGLMLVSSAASVVERCSVSLPHGASQLFAAGHLIITQLCGTCRLFLTQWSDRPSFREVKVKDVPALMAPRVKLIGLHQHSGDLYMVAHNRGVEVVEARGDGVVYKETIHIQMEGQILHAAFVGDCAVFSDENNHIFAVRDGRPLRTAQVDGCISCLEFLTSASYAYGTWNNILCVVDFATGTCLRRLMLESVPTSVCSITSSFSHIETVFIGTLDGFLIDTPLDGMLSSGLTDRGMKLMHTPVELRVLGDIVLAMGDAPLIIMPSQHGFQVTGLSLCGVVACGQLNPHLFAFLSQRENSIVLGSLDKVQKVSSRFTNLGFTVTHVRYISCWGGVVASLRRSQQDEIAFFSANSLETPWKVLTGSKERSSRHLLLENERCVFIEPLDLGGVNRSDPGERVPELGSLTNFVVLIGSSFVFPDEQKSRSSRIAWYSLDDTTQQMQLISSDDTSGAIQCCCPVPNFPGRVAVGICGCVVIYNWNAVDAKFVREERYRIGVTVTKLIPLFSPDVHRSSVVALDARHSAFFLSVDQLQGGISVMARESSLRSVMDGVLLSDTDLCMCDDRFNFLCLRMEECPPIAHPEGAHAAANDVPRHRLNTIAQCNMGDLVTSMQRGSFSQGALTSDSVPSVKSLLGGLTGPQVVYGTAHGSFGMITPIANATYLCLRAIELAVLDHVQPNGWFFDQVHRSVFTSGQHDFRHIIPSPGSTESADRAHRTPAGRNRSGHHHDSSAPLDVYFGTYGSASSRLIPQPHQMGEDQSKTTSQNVCDGEVVGRYLNLSGPARAGILAAAQRYTEIALGSFDSAGALKTFNGAVDFRFSGRPSKASLGTIAHKFNTLFASEGLPTLPYTDEAIRNLLLRVQRIQ